MINLNVFAALAVACWVGYMVVSTSSRPVYSYYDKSSDQILDNERFYVLMILPRG